MEDTFKPASGGVLTGCQKRINLYLILWNIYVNNFDCVVNVFPYIASNHTIFFMITLLPFLFSLYLGNLLLSYFFPFQD